MKLTGLVEEFDAEVGLGSITADDGRHYPFHCVEIADGTRTIDIGTTVEFDVLRKLGSYEAAHISPR